MCASAEKGKKLGVAKSIEKKERATLSKDIPESELLKDAKPAKTTPVDENVPTDQPAPDAADKSTAEEYNVKHPTKDRMRDKVRDLLAKALQTDKAPESDAVVVAAAIEEAMFKKFEGNGPPYKTKYRELSFNLKDPKNGKLRAAILARELVPSVLVEMSSGQLANEELKKTREKVQEKMTRDAMPYNKPAASTDQFKCGKCKERKCTYYQMQTRSADEPLTTFVQCVNCGNRWRF